MLNGIEGGFLQEFYAGYVEGGMMMGDATIRTPAGGQIHRWRFLLGAGLWLYATQGNHHEAFTDSGYYGSDDTLGSYPHIRLSLFALTVVLSDMYA